MKKENHGANKERLKKKSCKGLKKQVETRKVEKGKRTRERLNKKRKIEKSIKVKNRKEVQ